MAKFDWVRLDATIVANSAHIVHVPRGRRHLNVGRALRPSPCRDQNCRRCDQRISGDAGNKRPIAVPSLYSPIDERSSSYIVAIRFSSHHASFTIRVIHRHPVEVFAFFEDIADPRKGDVCACNEVTFRDGLGEGFEPRSHCP